MPETVKDRVRKVVSDVFDMPLEEVILETSNKTVENWDSLNLINLMIAVESEFGVSLDVGQAINLVSVEAILNILHDKGIS